MKSIKIRNLANAYIERGIFPEKNLDDALHVAIATYYEVSPVGAGRSGVTGEAG